MLIVATQSPFIKPLPQANTKASLLLTQDAVIASTLTLASEHFSHIYALDNDLIARGLLEKAKNNQNIEIINLSDFVQLTINNHPMMNW